MIGESTEETQMPTMLSKLFQQVLRLHGLQAQHCWELLLETAVALPQNLITMLQSVHIILLDHGVSFFRALDLPLMTLHLLLHVLIPVQVPFLPHLMEPQYRGTTVCLLGQLSPTPVPQGKNCTQHVEMMDSGRLLEPVELDHHLLHPHLHHPHLHHHPHLQHHQPHALTNSTKTRCSK